MSQPLPPRCAERYTHVRLVGTGAHGAVFLATQRGLDRPVAVKVLHIEVSRDVETVTRFGQEARFTAGLVHPNIVRVIEHDLEDDPPWIAYEYLEGLTLHQVVQKGPMPWRTALSATLQVLSALTAAHGQGILHRDIKPSNVIQAGDDVYKLTDFGLARLATGAEKVTRTGCIVGTPAYLAPEVMHGEDHSPASDIFAVGAMLYKLTTGEIPPRGDLGMIPGHLEEPGLPTPSSVEASVPPAVDRIVQGCTCREPALRWPSAKSLRLAVEEALADPQNGAQSAGLRSEVRRRSREKTQRDGALAGRRTRPGSTLLDMTATLVAASAKRPHRALGATLALLAAFSVTLALVVSRTAPRPWVELRASGPASVTPNGGPPKTFEGKQPGASAAPRALPDRAHFRALVARVRSHWAQYPLILTAMNPLHSDLPEAARLAGAVFPHARSDHAEIARICDVLTDAYPDPRTAPEEASFWLARTAAARFFAWTYLQVVTEVVDTTGRMLSPGHGPSSTHEAMGSFAAMNFGHDGVVLIRRYLASALPLFEAMAAAPDRAGPDTFDLLFDARELARYRGMGLWKRSDDDEVRRLCNKFKDDLGRLHGPAGGPLGRVLVRFVEWGDPAGKERMTRASYEDALFDIDALANACPGARASIQSLSRHMRDEMASFPASARGR